MQNQKQLETIYKNKRNRRNKISPNLNISDEKLQLLYSKIKPIIKNEGKLFYIKDVNLKNQSFTWEPEYVAEAKNIYPFKTIITFHTYGYYGLFKPSISEVLAQIPQKYLDKCVAFKINDDNLTFRNILDNYHIVTTTLFTNIS